MRKHILPHKLGKYRGKTYSRYTVNLQQSGLCWENNLQVEIVAESPAAACNALQSEFGPFLQRPTEFTTLGARGGITHRYLGWESLVGAHLWAARSNTEQLAFAL